MADASELVELIIPLAVGRTFTYRVPGGRRSLRIGVRVTVHFGKGRKIYTGLICKLNATAKEGVKAKHILSIIDERPIVTKEQIDLWLRMADYYMCTPGEIMLAALPSQLILSSETRIVPAPYQETRSDLPEQEQLALSILDQRNVLNLTELGDLLQLNVPFNKVKQWMDAGHVSIEERILDTFKPKRTEVVELSAEYRTEEALNEAFDALSRAPKQTEILMRVIQLADPLSGDPVAIEKTRLLKAANASSTALKPLISKGILTVKERDDVPTGIDVNQPLPALSKSQEEAYHNLINCLQDRHVCVLHGVTSSGKTELYLRLIQQYLKEGEQVLYLLPEIALTTQMIARVQARLGDGVRVYHSRLTVRERARLWMDLVNHPDKVKIILSARSGIFLPLKDLGLVIVDEEHDPSFKQYDPAPRYNARDMAVLIGSMFNARVVLGSATPSIESLHNASSGKYGHVLLTERYGNVNLPEITTANIQEARRRHLMKGRFTPELLSAIEHRLARNEQIILFQNRRGYTPVWQCTDCGWVPECDHCDVSLTYHKRDHRLRCHYCGKTYEPITRCKACGSTKLKMIGFGTEMLEEEIRTLFPQAEVARLDQDTARGKKAFARILQRMIDGTTDILVGTQMVTKGLDLDHVTLVGIMNADALIRFPDFRASERAFQLMAQVAGRAGRRQTQGSVLIQTYDPHQPIISLVKSNDMNGLYHSELEERERYFYPPYSRLIKLTLKYRDQTKVNACAHALFARLEPYFKARVLGPETPYIGRIKDKYLRNILLKLSKSKYSGEKGIVQSAIEEVLTIERFRTVRIVIDVDPG